MGVLLICMPLLWRKLEKTPGGMGENTQTLIKTLQTASSLKLRSFLKYMLVVCSLPVKLLRSVTDLWTSMCRKEETYCRCYSLHWPTMRVSSSINNADRICCKSLSSSKFNSTNQYFFYMPLDYTNDWFSFCSSCSQSGLVITYMAAGQYRASILSFL